MLNKEIIPHLRIQYVFERRLSETTKKLYLICFIYDYFIEASFYDVVCPHEEKRPTLGLFDKCIYTPEYAELF